MTSLNYRRAKFVYEGARIAAMASGAPIVPEPYDDREEAFRTQFEKVIERQMGPERSSDAEALHEDWVRAYEKMGWVYGAARDVEKKTHPDMVPYAELGHLEKDKDAVFVALCEIARKWVHEPNADCDDQQELEKQIAALRAEVARLTDKVSWHESGADRDRLLIQRLEAVVRKPQALIEAENRVLELAIELAYAIKREDNKASAYLRDLPGAVRRLEEWRHRALAAPTSEEGDDGHSDC